MDANIVFVLDYIHVRLVRRFFLFLNSQIKLWKSANWGVEWKLESDNLNPFWVSLNSTVRIWRPYSNLSTEL